MVRNSSKINNYINENRNRKFEWGVFDCCTMVCDIAVLQGGDDIAKDVRGTYTTAIGAKRVLKKHFGSMEEAFDKFDSIDVRFIQPGDLVMLDGDEEPLMGFFYGEGYYIVGVEEGLGLMADDFKPLKAWRVSSW